VFVLLRPVAGTPAKKPLCIVVRKHPSRVIYTGWIIALVTKKADNQYLDALIKGVE
jgi:hypothetical protein